MDQYDKGEKLGQGQFGVVNKAVHKKVIIEQCTVLIMCPRYPLLEGAQMLKSTLLADWKGCGHQEDPSWPCQGGTSSQTPYSTAFLTAHAIHVKYDPGNGVNCDSVQGINMTALREIKLLRELESPYILKLLDVFPHKRNLSLVMTFPTHSTKYIQPKHSICGGTTRRHVWK